MLFVGGLLELGGPLANVLDGQRRDDDKGFVKATVVLGFHQHPCHPRIHRNLGQLAADRRQFGVAGLGTSRDGAEFLEESDSVLHGALVRRFDEGECRDVAQAEGRHLQDHGCEVGSQDLRFGECRP